jgi:hypothetical protein
MSLNELLALNPKYKDNPDHIKTGALLILKDNAGEICCHYMIERLRYYIHVG